MCSTEVAPSCEQRDHPNSALILLSLAGRTTSFHSVVSLHSPPRGHLSQVEKLAFLLFKNMVVPQSSGDSPFLLQEDSPSF